MGSHAIVPRYFLTESEMPTGFSYPEQYIEFVTQNGQHPVAMVGMPPWIFASDLLWAKNESIAEFGTLLVPFAQAEGMDMVSYFEVTGDKSPRVLVANPWEQLSSLKVIRWLNDFEEWLIFARQVSQDAIRDRPHLLQKPFWFPADRSKVQ